MTTTRTESYVASSPVDRLGVWLSLRAVRPHVRGRVVDLGCGHEATLLRALRPGDGLGIDVAVSAEARATPGLRFDERPVEEALPALPAASADTVLAINVLEHLWEDERVLAECHRVIAPGGKLVLNVPTWLGRRALEFSAFRLGLSPAEEMDDHKRYYDPRDLWPRLVRAGFSPSHLKLRRHKLGLNLFAVGVRR